MNIEKSVKEIVKEQLGWGNTELLTLSTSPHDVGLDTLDEIEIIMALEEEFDTEIPDSVAESFNTLGDIIAFLEKEDHHNKFGKERGANILASFSVPEDNTNQEGYSFLRGCWGKYTPFEKHAAYFTTPHNPVKNISREKYYRCAKRNPNLCEQFNSDKGIVFMSDSLCGKYYYWEGYNSDNDIIYFRGEKSWVEGNYEKVASAKSKKPREVSNDVRKVIDKIKDNFKEGKYGKVTSSGKFKTRDNGSLLIPNNISANEAMDHICDYVDYLGEGEKDTLKSKEGGENLTTWTDRHYDFTYTLTEDDIEKGVIKIDPYFVADQWKLGEKDNSGVIFHILKTCSRYKTKHEEEREIKAIYGQIKRLAEIRGVEL